MKMFTLALVILTSTSAMAAATGAQSKVTPSQKICDSLQDQIDEECAHLMCDDLIEDGTFNNLGECTSGDDYAEGAQATCEALPTLEDLVAKYNKEHRKANLTCE